MVQLETMTLDWKMSGIGDFNKDGNPDILWRNPSTGENLVWYMDGVVRIMNAILPSVAGERWIMMARRN